MNLTARFVILIIALMLPIFFLYTYNIRETNTVIDNQIESFNRSRMDYFRYQLDSSIANTSMFAFNLSNDRDVQLYTTHYANELGYDRDQIFKTIESKIELLNGYGNPWNDQIMLHFPDTRTVISNSIVRKYNEQYLLDHAEQKWYYEPSEMLGSAPRNMFTRLYSGSSRNGANVLASPVVVSVSLPAANIVAMLDAFKTTGINDPFFFREGDGVLYNSNADATIIDRLLPYIGGSGEEAVRRIVKLDNRKYVVYSQYSQQLGWILADYVPLENIMKPINHSRIIFYITLALLLLLGIAACVMLFMQIQMPLRLLIKNMQKLKEGKLSIRITSRVRNEFQQLIDGFNEMASEIQKLVEYKYLSDIRSKEAIIKQLQSQINPHFIYNCFASIIGMAKMNYNESIIALSHNLADYYKNVTYNESHVTTLKEELNFVGQYLDIMNMQLSKFNYDIVVDPGIEDVVIPRLLIQPLVENAVLHGLEPKMGDGKIKIVVSVAEERINVLVEDDGMGMSDVMLNRLNKQIANERETSEIGIGLWNVNRRMHYFFGHKAEFQVYRSLEGGISVRLSWCK